MTKAYDERGAAEFLSCSRALLRKWRRMGGGPKYVRLGDRVIRYRVDELEKFFDLCTVTHPRTGPDKGRATDKGTRQ